MKWSRLERQAGDARNSTTGHPSLTQSFAGSVLLSGTPRNALRAASIGHSPDPVFNLTAALPLERHSNPQAVAEIGTKFAGFLPRGNRMRRHDNHFRDHYHY